MSFLLLSSSNRLYAVDLWPKKSRRTTMMKNMNKVRPRRPSKTGIQYPSLILMVHAGPLQSFSQMQIPFKWLHCPFLEHSSGSPGHRWNSAYVKEELLGVKSYPFCEILRSTVR